MGLDVIIGIEKDDELFPLLEEVLQRSGLMLPEAATEEFNDPSGRAYAFHDFAEFCRKEMLPCPHLRNLTCSCWQMIVPIDFPDPLQQFAHKQPEEYENLWIPDDYGLSPEEQEKFQEERDREMMEGLKIERMLRLAPRYPYYTNTPASDVYLLSAQQMLVELKSYFDRFVPGWNEESFEWDEKKLHDQARNAAYLYNCLNASVQSNNVIWFSG